MKHDLLARTDSGLIVVADPTAVTKLAMRPIQNSEGGELELAAETSQGKAFVLRLPMQSAELHFRLFVDEPPTWGTLPSTKKDRLVENRVLQIPSGTLCVAGTDDFCTACKDHGYRGRLEVEPGHYLLGSRLQHWSADDWKSRQEEFAANSISRSARRISSAAGEVFGCLFAASFILLPIALVGGYWWDGWSAVWSLVRWLSWPIAVILATYVLLQLSPPMHQFRAARRKFRELYHSRTDLVITLRQPELFQG